MRDVIEPLELTAYADGQLGPERRIAIERWLSRNPQAAAQVMADLHLRNEIVLAHQDESTSNAPGTAALALRLGDKLTRGHGLGRFRPLLAACLLLTLGWLGHDMVSQADPVAVPEYVTAAVEAHYTTELRAQMHFQTQPMGADAAEMLAKTQIELPALPADWKVTDIQLYPSEFGPSVEVAVDAQRLGLVSIFAAHPGLDQIVPPVTRRVQNTTTAYWQYGTTAYALVASAGSTDVRNAAASLFNSMH